MRMSSTEQWLRAMRSTLTPNVPVHRVSPTTALPPTESLRARSPRPRECQPACGGCFRACSAVGKTHANELPPQIVPLCLRKCLLSLPFPERISMPVTGQLSVPVTALIYTSIRLLYARLLAPSLPFAPPPPPPPAHYPRPKTKSSVLPPGRRFSSMASGESSGSSAPTSPAPSRTVAHQSKCTPGWLVPIFFAHSQHWNQPLGACYVTIN